MPSWLAPMAALAAQAGTPAPCDGALCFADALTPFFARLKESETGNGPPLHILQIGDSHTAGDMVTEPWRRRLQRRLGPGGRGVLAAGRPYPGYLTWGVTAGQSGGWSVNGVFGRSYSADGPLLGLSGFTQTARAPGETLTLDADTPDQAFDRLIVCGLGQPGGGTVMLRLGAAAERWSLDLPEPFPTCRTLVSETPAVSASVTTEDAGTVSITSIGAFRREGGAILSNLGVAGAQLTHLARANDGVIATELDAYGPDLIVLAFGTNEGFSPVLSPDAYEAALREQVDRLRVLVGREVPILLLAAPDAATRQASLGQGGIACGGGLSIPHRLGAVRERQRAVARAMGLAFWDWSAAMGGYCASLRWTRDGLMRPDHVHFSRDGGERIGAMIDSDLSRAGGPVR